MEKILVTNQQTKIDAIEVADLSLQLLLSKQRKLTTLIDLPKANNNNATENLAETSESAKLDGTSPSTHTTEPYAVVVNRLQVFGNSAIEFRDQGVTPHFHQRIDIDSLTVEGLNTGNPEQAMHVVLEGKTDKYSQLKSDTRIWPFKEKLTVDTRTELQEINLNPVTPYLSETLGYDIESGQLDMNIALNIDQGLMDGQTKLSLRQFDLGGTNNSDSTEQSSPAKGLNRAIPLNLAVNMLKDRSENIELDIPITGDVTSPQFGWGSFISLILKNALYEATAGVVMQSFLPYANVLTIAKIAGDQLLKVSVEPLLYPPGITDPTDANPVFVDQLKKLMADKPEIQIKACAVASAQDLDKGVADSELSAEQRQQLNSLAITRGEAFKDTIIADGRIQSSRILLCQPKLDVDKAAQGRIEFEI